MFVEKIKIIFLKNYFSQKKKSKKKIENVEHIFLGVFSFEVFFSVAVLSINDHSSPNFCFPASKCILS